jgi:hypothetical protein
MPAVFIAQATLQQWADAGKVHLEDTTLYLLKEQRSVVLKPAVRFTKLTVGDSDPHGLLGKVKSTEQLKAMGAEHYMDSVICGDVAYEVVEGFLGDLQGGQPVAPEAMPKAAPVRSATPAPVALGDLPAPPKAEAERKAEPAPEASSSAPAAEPEELSEAEALSRLFLDTVR